MRHVAVFAALLLAATTASAQPRPSGFATGTPLYIAGTVRSITWGKQPSITIAARSAAPVPDGVSMLAAEDQERTGPGGPPVIRAPEGNWKIILPPLSLLRRAGMAQPPQLNQEFAVVGVAKCDGSTEALPLVAIPLAGRRMQLALLSRVPKGC